MPESLLERYEAVSKSHAGAARLTVHPMSGARSWLWVMPLALLVTALLAAVATWSQARAIQSDLTSRSQAALASAGISGGEVSFDGRDATLQGFPADKAQPAADAVRKVEGVRGVGVVVQEKPAMTSSRETPPSTDAVASLHPRPHRCE